ncbi:hypothetical protein [Actinokineospora diospyrosa]|uniref:CDP-glycerol:poly(Glycerophosphate) glycerophosphotransferase n=1 Tax=Actinokineospora diospyrosa TaxID=103728 RepID=A0ABT1I9H1_9PSEU|nr:hypothetical protein [Actinokineospora diospyrosa]MCP2269274.1 hypothetical protein [Actinokineospora diospyrosa]
MVAAEQEGSRVLAPGERAAAPWTTFAGKTVLVLAQHPQAVTRLLFDVLPLLLTDPRINVVWTTPDLRYRWSSEFDDFLRELGIARVPWWQVLTTPYDLVLSACFGGLDETIGPKVKLPHGINGARSRIGPFPDEEQHDLRREKLMKDGKVVASALMLSHEDELAVLAKSCPEALPHAVVAGCPSFDRMLVSRRRAKRYRRALRVCPWQKLVVVSTTWSEHSLWGSDPTVFARLRAALPSWRYRIVVIVHPFIWLLHGRPAVLVRLKQAGVTALPYREGWRAALIAADLLAGDHGSVTQYGAALGLPVLMTTRSLRDVRRDSTADRLSRLATPFDPRKPLLRQVRAALKAGGSRDFADIALSNHGQATEIIHRVCYELLGIPKPGGVVLVRPLRRPFPIDLSDVE